MLVLTVLVVVRGAGDVGTRVIHELRFEQAFCEKYNSVKGTGYSSLEHELHTHSPLGSICHNMTTEGSIGVLVEEPVPIASTGNTGTSNAAALDSGGKAVTGKPCPLTVSADLTNNIVAILVVDTDAPGTIGVKANGSKVRVMGGSILSGKFTVVPAALAPTPAALKGKYWLAVLSDFGDTVKIR